MLEYSGHAVICLLALYCLFSRPDQLLSWGMPADVRGWDTGVSWGKKHWSICDLLGLWPGRKWRPQQVFCYRAVDETGELDFRISGRCVCLPSAYLLTWRNAGRESLGRDGLQDPQGVWAGMGDAATGILLQLYGQDLELGSGKTQREEKICKQPTLFSGGSDPEYI